MNRLCHKSTNIYNYNFFVLCWPLRVSDDVTLTSLKMQIKTADQWHVVTEPQHLFSLEETVASTS